MTVILETPVSAMGAALALADVGMTATDIYDRYKALVVADGGEIVDEAAVKSMIFWLYARDLNPGAMGVSPAWGIKRSGNKIICAYSLDGSILDAVGDVTFDTSSYAFRCFNFVTPDAHLLSRDDQVLIPSYRVGVVMVAPVPPTGNDRLTAVSYEDLASPNSHIALTVSYNAATYRFKAWLKKNTDGLMTSLDRTASLSAANVLGVHVNTGASQLMQIMHQGVQYTTTRNHSGAFMRSLKQYKGRFAVNRWSSGGRYIADHAGHAKCGVAMLVPNATFEQTLALTAHLNGIYN